MGDCCSKDQAQMSDLQRINQQAKEQLSTWNRNSRMMFSDTAYSSSSKARLPTFITPKKMEKYINLVRYGVENIKSTQRKQIQPHQKKKVSFSENIDELLEQFIDNVEQWQLVFQEIVRLYNIDLDLEDSFTDTNYINAIKSKRMYKIKGSETTYRHITSRGILTLIKANAIDFNKRNNSDYWVLDYHKESIFKEPVPHLKNVFFFRPSFVAHQINYGKYRIYIRQAIDLNCNMMEQCTLKISVKESQQQDDDYQVIHEMSFINQDMFDELLKQSPSFIDCLLIDFNFEEDDEQDMDLLGEDKINKIESQSCNVPGTIQKSNVKDNTPFYKTVQSNIQKTIDVMFEFQSESYEWKQGWWVDAFIFEPILQDDE